MERGLRDLEEEIQMLKSNGALSTEEREEEMKQMEVYRSHSKFMKNKVLRKQMTSKMNRAQQTDERSFCVSVRSYSLGSHSGAQKQNLFVFCHEATKIILKHFREF